MFDKILIANRGEVALRVIRATKEMGIKSVVVYSTADADTEAVRMADEAVCIGPAQSAKSYLNIPAIIGAAQITGAEAIHPGYGFLAENSDFARACIDNDIVFIGPDPDVMDALGNKANAKETAARAHVPTVPGSDGVVESVEDAREFARKVGYPVLVKASAGGGGKGMREVYSDEEMESAFNTARNEALSAFGNGDCYIEKLILRPRHVEIQVLADKHGNRVHLCERDCSIQRRHQKLIEEAPSPALTEELRQEMGATALRMVEASGYTNAGTVEFLLDVDDSFYFMEMNARVQVEHGVSESITGVDIIKEQIRIAAGEEMTCKDRAPFSPFGHAIEFRINAEDPDNDFRPSPGKITKLRMPAGPGVRVDTHLYEGYTIPPYYDSMLAKLVVWGIDRDEAIDRARRALDEFVIEGIPTTIPFHKMVVENEDFQRGEVYTDFIEKEFGDN
ncbi:MAG: acetyl-CoA carboxylase biotin carboxylase subunit [Coriobacteriales bacterium]|jgi:acetyl-CoA carboxylase biotin carboxylase subunit